MALRALSLLSAPNSSATKRLCMIATVVAGLGLLGALVGCAGNGDGGASNNSDPTPTLGVSVLTSKFTPTEIGQVDAKVDSLFEVYPSLETEKIAAEMTLGEMLPLFKPDCEDTSLPARERAESCANLAFVLWSAALIVPSSDLFDAAILVKNYAITEMPEQEGRILDLLRELGAL